MNRWFSLADTVLLLPFAIEVSRFLSKLLTGFTLALIMANFSLAVDIVVQFDQAQSEKPTFDPNAESLQAFFEYAAQFYEDVFEDNGPYTTITIDYWYENLPGILGLHDLVVQEGTPSRETEATIRINTEVGSGGYEQDYYLDPTPTDHVEFNMQQTLFQDLADSDQALFFTGTVPSVLETGYQGTASTSQAQNITDLLTLVLHEVGHTLGMSATNTSTISETADGDYDVDPQFIGGATMGIKYSSVNNIAHLADSFSLMSPTIPTNRRLLPSSTDLLAMASSHGYSEVDLPHKDFLAGTTNAWDATHWIGNRNPDMDDDAYIRSPYVDPLVQLVNASQAKNLLLAEGDQLVTNNHALDVVQKITVEGPGTTLTLNHAAGSVSADTIWVNNAGQLIVTEGTATASDIRLTGSGRLDLSGGHLDVIELDLTDGTLNMTNGSLHSAMIQGNFQMLGGYFSPSHTTGPTFVQGTYLQNSTSTLEIELNGPVVGVDYDQLRINGTANLAGTLELLPRFPPMSEFIGETFVIMTHGGAVGSFETVTGRHTGNGIFFDIVYHPNEITLTPWQAISGDIDGDHDVDITDFGILAYHFDPGGKHHTWTDGDFDGDLDVDITDFTRLANYFSPAGYKSEEPWIAVPEPTSLLATILGFLFVTGSSSSMERNLIRLNPQEERSDD